MVSYEFSTHVIEQTNRGERSYDIFSRLLNDRIVMLTDEVNNTTASLVVAKTTFIFGRPGPYQRYSLVYQ